MSYKIIVKQVITKELTIPHDNESEAYHIMMLFPKAKVITKEYIKVKS